MGLSIGYCSCSKILLKDLLRGNVIGEKDTPHWLFVIRDATKLSAADATGSILASANLSCYILPKRVHPAPYSSPDNLYRTDSSSVSHCIQLHVKWIFVLGLAKSLSHDDHVGIVDCQTIYLRVNFDCKIPAPSHKFGRTDLRTTATSFQVL